ncbi:hypothetical protein HMPREF3038_00612 [Akkermansia sp. KLE1797]|nr:hypothetical protein HMPREF3038_00612 [Akkermansia sp. KLE1797]KXU54305.1 hypothetical protein HMPREF3039_01634 [Akkermansia sp. KLE1798]KZA04659.1 hypothetical protein HMPREF1326_01714 [Akkermansia sp. KLE1605]
MGKSGFEIRSQPTNLRKNNLMQICSVISTGRMPEKQDSRTLWLNVPKRNERGR